MLQRLMKILIEKCLEHARSDPSQGRHLATVKPAPPLYVFSAHKDVIET